MFYGYEALSASELPVYCSERMGRFLTENGPWSQLVRLKNISLRILAPDKDVSLTKNVSFVPFQVPHRAEYTDTLGYVISGRDKSLLYIPDIQSWEAWNRSICDEVGKVDIALLDGTFYGPEELPGRDWTKIGHPFITTSLKTLQSSVYENKKRIFFTHLNHTNLVLDPEGRSRQTVLEASFDIASDGMEFFL
jgi:pyrroloquinoline quinone biosynthesis protein B